MQTGKQEIRHYKSPAASVWLGILVLVLFLLFIQTGNKPQSGFNTIVVTDADRVGNEILIDGKPKGTISAMDKDGSDGVAWLKLPNGEHTIELRKNGKTAMSRTIKVDNREYVDLSREPVKHD
ncbi:MAG: hypothetical protein K8F91_16155 [Candidatus Obscuribacterales bacterium]|nr:hypothetical protein [Candidatus Obscuribacterales bacterium]